mmetsp:Transcript_35902/g.34951  ORF Transcript_35902/g.34951 Transcript_35902/m.34951 type:complete len:108 (-) Transcript_35902:727-1050(-)
MIIIGSWLEALVVTGVTEVVNTLPHFPTGTSLHEGVRTQQVHLNGRAVHFLDLAPILLTRFLHHLVDLFLQLVNGSGIGRVGIVTECIHLSLQRLLLRGVVEQIEVV